MHLDEETILENGENMSDKTYLDMASGFIPFSRKEKVPIDKIQKTQAMEIILNAIEKYNGGKNNA